MLRFEEETKPKLRSRTKTWSEQTSVCFVKEMSNAQAKKQKERNRSKKTILIGKKFGQKSKEDQLKNANAQCNNESCLPDCWIMKK